MPKYLTNGRLVMDPTVGDEVSARINDLVGNQAATLATRDRIRKIMDGGDGAVEALLGEGWAKAVDGMPVANMMLSGMTRLAQKLGRRPDVKVDPPVTKDSDSARKRAETRARIVETYDAESKLELRLPQIGRWLPGYGFITMVLRQGRTSSGEPFPHAELRDPYETFVGPWGVEQQPPDVAYLRVIEREQLAKMYPAFAEKIRAGKASLSQHQRFGVSAAGRITAEQRWEARGADTVEVYEYINIEGTWWVLPECNLVLSFVRNPLKYRPPFYAVKRYSFSALTSQYEHVIGLMAAMARMNLLTLVAAEDSVMSETNIIGELIGERYETGRGAVNHLTPGSQVQKMNNQVPFQVLQQADRLERQLRIVEAYPVTDDTISPNSFVTGRGLDELTSAVDREVREYFTLLADLHVELDAMRLEWDEAVYPERKKTMHAVRNGAPFAETYKPAAAIAGDYRTRRVYGAMAGFDDATKIVTGLQLLQGDIIDSDTMREQIDGLENHTKIKERIRAEKAERVFFDMALQMASQGDERAVLSVLDFLPEGEMRNKAMELFGPPDPEEEAAMAQQQQMAGLAAGGAPPDAATVLQRLVAGPGGTTATQGVQTVGQF